MRSITFGFLGAFALAGSAALAATPMDLTIIDRAVADFTGSTMGQPGGARQPVDRRLRLSPCSGALDLEWFGRDQRSVQVACPTAGWKIYVAVDGGPVSARAPASMAAASPANRYSARPAPSETIVQRGEGVTVLVRGGGFTLTRQGEALESGGLGEWIKIRPSGERTAVLRAQVLRPGQVGMDLP